MVGDISYLEVFAMSAVEFCFLLEQDMGMTLSLLLSQVLSMDEKESDSGQFKYGLIMEMKIMIARIVDVGIIKDRSRYGT